MKCMLLAGLATVLSLSGCATVSDVGGRAVDVVERICPPVQAVMTVLSVPGTVDPALESDLVLAGQLVDRSPLASDDKRTALLGIAVAQAAIGASR